MILTFLIYKNQTYTATRSVNNYINNIIGIAGTSVTLSQQLN